MLELYMMKIPPYSLDSKKNFKALADWILDPARKKLIDTFWQRKELDRLRRIKKLEAVKQ